MLPVLLLGELEPSEAAAIDAAPPAAATASTPKVRLLS
jgi:hypothetical protein